MQKCENHSGVSLMIDLADLWRGASAEARAAIQSRLLRMAAAVAAFAAGCAAAALVYAQQGLWCFVIPPLIAAWTLWLGESVSEKIQ